MRWVVVALMLAGCPGPEPTAPVCEPVPGQVLVIEFPAGGGLPVVSVP